MYGGDSLTETLPAQITPDVQLHVAVTVHDIKGNVHLDELNTVMVTPIDNNADTTPPDRLIDISLSDKPQDDGTAVVLDFELSDESDIESYEIYAAAFTFTSVGAQGNGPENPIVTLDRSPELPLEIKILAYDTLVIPNMAVTVAVVPVDSAGNAYRNNLVTATTIAIDDGVRDPGASLPDITGVSLKWIDDSISVSWTFTSDPNVRSYLVYIHSSEFMEVSDATMVGEISAANVMLITPDSFTDLDPEETWWIGVAASDGTTSRQIIESNELLPPGKDGSGGSGDGDDEGSSDNLGELLSTDNLILGSMVLVALILLMLVLRGRGGKQRRDKEWELQEATWGIQARDGWDDVGSFGGNVALQLQHRLLFNRKLKLTFTLLQIVSISRLNNKRKPNHKDGLNLHNLHKVEWIHPFG